MLFVADPLETMWNCIRDACKVAGLDSGEVQKEVITSGLEGMDTEDPHFNAFLLEGCIYRCFGTLSLDRIRAKAKDLEYKKVAHKCMLSLDELIRLAQKATPRASSTDSKGGGAPPNQTPPAPVSPDPKEDALAKALANAGAASEHAFTRFAPAVRQVASVLTVQPLFSSLAKSGTVSKGITYATWDAYISNLSKIQQSCSSATVALSQKLGFAEGEVVVAEVNASLTVGSGTDKSVLGAGHFVLTQRALYFQADGSFFYSAAATPVQRFDLSLAGGSPQVSQHVAAFSLFSSTHSISLTSQPSAPWVMDFVEYSTDRLRDRWLALISEVISVREFIRQYQPVKGRRQRFGLLLQLKAQLEIARRNRRARRQPKQSGGEGADLDEDDDEEEDEEDEEEEAEDAVGQEAQGQEQVLFLSFVRKGAEHAVSLSMDSIMQLQALCLVCPGLLPTHMVRQLPFSWASTAPLGHLVEQAVALVVWDRAALSAAEAERRLGSGRAGVPRTAPSAGSAAGLGALAEGDEEEEGEGDERVVAAADVSQGGAGVRHRLLPGGPPRLPPPGMRLTKGKPSLARVSSWKLGSSVSFWKERGQSDKPGAGEASGWFAPFGSVQGGGRSKLSRALRVAREKEGKVDVAENTVNAIDFTKLDYNVHLLKKLLEPMDIMSATVTDTLSWKRPPVTIFSAMALLFMVNGGMLWLLPPAVFATYGLILLGFIPNTILPPELMPRGKCVGAAAAAAAVAAANVSASVASVSPRVLTSATPLSASKPSVAAAAAEVAGSGTGGTGAAASGWGDWSSWGFSPSTTPSTTTPSTASTSSAPAAAAPAAGARTTTPAAASMWWGLGWAEEESPEEVQKIDPILVERPPPLNLESLMEIKAIVDSITGKLADVCVFLLKCRTILNGDYPEANNIVAAVSLALAVALLLAALILPLIPFRVVATLVILHAYSAGMQFHALDGRAPAGPTSQAPGVRIKRWWATVPVAPVKWVEPGSLVKKKDAAAAAAARATTTAAAASAISHPEA